LPSYADIIYLKNGAKIEGLVKEIDKKYLELNVGFGTVWFERKEIKQIYKSTPQEVAKIQKRWEEERLKSERLESEAIRIREQLKQEYERKKLEEEKLHKETELKTIPLNKEKGQIVVSAVLNDSIRAELVLDTGASLVLLTKNIAKNLGLDKDTSNIELLLADGRKIKAKFTILKSVKIEDVQAQDIETAVLLEDVPDSNFKDGLLGMSFLSRFNFTVDPESGKLILKKADRR
jgi:clan AA aspartic protease (TIGR02281 family)